MKTTIGQGSITQMENASQELSDTMNGENVEDQKALPEQSGCDYVAGSNKPCKTCPRLITCLYMCKYLQEGSKDE